MYEYDTILNGKTARDAYAEKIQEAEKWRQIHNLPSQRKNNVIRNLMNYVLNIVS